MNFGQVSKKQNSQAHWGAGCLGASCDYEDLFDAVRREMFFS
jgi:hypothetical protein